MSEEKRSLAVKLTAIFFIVIAVAALTEGISFVALKIFTYKLATPGWQDGFSVTGWPRGVGLRFSSAGTTVEIKANDHGFRDAEWKVDKNPNTFRVLLFGDSMLEGWGVPQDKTIASHLRRSLEALSTDDSPIEIISLGLNRTGPGFAYCLYRDWANSFRPDMVIYLSYVGNDFADAEREAKECMGNRNPIERVKRFPYTLALANLVNILDEQSRTLREIKRHPTYKDFPPEFRTKIDNKEIHLPLLELALRDRQGAEGWVRPPAANQEREYRRFLELFARAVASDGVSNMLVMPLPVSIQVSTEQFEEFKELGFSVPDGLIGNFTRQTLIRGIVDDLAPQLSGVVGYVDVNEAYIKATKRSRLFIPYDIHINAAGHQLVADELSRSIRAVLSKRTPVSH